MRYKNNTEAYLKRIADKIDPQEPPDWSWLDNLRVPYDFLVDIGHKNKITFLLLSLPLRLIFGGLFRGLLMSIFVIIIGTIVGLFLCFLIWLITKSSPPPRIIGQIISYIGIIGPTLYYFIKIFKEEIALFKELHGNK
jgi:hypothetical protein